MLQQTRVEQALPYYRAFLRAFPSMRALSRAPLSRVVKQWEGLGYYRRAAQLHETARQLSGRRKIEVADLEACPGIGPYTLAAVASIVLSRPIPVIDGNVRRVMARILALDRPPTERTTAETIARALEAIISHRRPGDFNQAMMELGATICRPKLPDCARCPVSGWCRAYAAGNPEAYPVRTRKPPRPHRHIAAAVIRRRDGRILIAQRLPHGLLPNLWEFPGGKQERGETLQQCCIREIREELGIGISVGKKIAKVDHAYSHYSVTLHFFSCRLVSGAPKALGCQAWRWVHPSCLRDFAFPRANWPVLDLLAGTSV